MTRLLRSASAGNADALDQILPLVYEELKAVAANVRRQNSQPAATLNTTVLVNEAWIKLQKHGLDVKDRKHFYCLVSKTIRHLLIDAARKKKAKKRDVELISLENDHLDTKQSADWFVYLEQILKRLELQRPRLGEVFQLVYFAGFSLLEVAEILEISESTARREWLTTKGMVADLMADFSG